MSLIGLNKTYFLSSESTIGHSNCQNYLLKISLFNKLWNCFDGLIVRCELCTSLDISV